ncbi:MarR family winged helix-turn-helix transcriptional regulator [Paenibacillus alkalitolerans]|uniref:MarR family winged helix-turn-helix transcriptional regulator n=1 Tax=Paenibacillus alkalitolerans TaxID=2799335 RepID=UPI0018F5ADDB|nr:MarR family transcriptional regulator [Paenibacillus alkalitolerans]
MIEGAVLKQLIERYLKAMFLVERKFGVLLKDELVGDLTPEQSKILLYIRTNESCTSTELAEAFSVGKSSVTAIIARLVDKDLVRRIPDRKDRRVIYLSLTGKGREAALEIEENTHRVLSRLIANFTPEEASAFIETYEKLARVLMQASEEGEIGK